MGAVLVLLVSCLAPYFVVLGLSGSGSRPHGICVQYNIRCDRPGVSRSGRTCYSLLCHGKLY